MICHCSRSIPKSCGSRLSPVLFTDLSAAGVPQKVREPLDALGLFAGPHNCVVDARRRVVISDSARSLSRRHWNRGSIALAIWHREFRVEHDSRLATPGEGFKHDGSSLRPDGNVLSVPAPSVLVLRRNIPPHWPISVVNVCKPQPRGFSGPAACQPDESHERPQRRLQVSQHRLDPFIINSLASGCFRDCRHLAASQRFDLP